MSNVSWVEAPEEQAGKILVGYAKYLEARQNTYVQMCELFASIYAERKNVTIRPSRTKRLAPLSTKSTSTSFNISRVLCDTEHAIICENRPLPKVVTEGANREMQDKAMALQHAITGIFTELKVWDTGERAELDKTIFGGAAATVRKVNGRPHVARVLFADLLVDEDLLTTSGEPHQITHRMEMPRRSMLAWFKDAGAEVLAAIEKAPAITTSQDGDRGDLIVVYDAYSLPLDVDTPGRHAIAIDGYDGLLFVEEWKKNRLPFVFMRWCQPPTGWYPVGVIEQCMASQFSIARFLRTIQQACEDFGVATLLVPTLSKIDVNKWTNAPTKIMPFDPAGGTPQMFAPRVIDEYILRFLEWQIEHCFKSTGIQELASYAQRAPGLTSNAAQVTIAAKAAQRLNPHSTAYENFYVEIAYRVCDILRELKEDKEKLVITTVDNGVLRRVDMDKALSLGESDFKIDIFPVPLLSRHPATRTQQVQDLVTGGVIEKSQLRQLVSNPDVDAALGKDVDFKGIYMTQATALLDNPAAFVEPDEFTKLDIAVPIYHDMLIQAQADGVPEERLDSLRDWLTKARDIQTAQDPPQAPAAEQTPQAQPDAAQPQGPQQ